MVYFAPPPPPGPNVIVKLCPIIIGTVTTGRRPAALSHNSAKVFPQTQCCAMHSTKAYGGRGFIAPLIHKLYTRLRLVVKFTPLLP